MNTAAMPFGAGALGTFEDSTPLLGDVEALRERAGRDGYLFLRGLLPREEVLAVREELLEVVGRHGWRAAGQDALGGRIDLEAINRVPDEEMRLDIGVSIAAYHDAQRREAPHRLPHHPALKGFYRSLFDREVLVHPRHIMRMVTGHRAMVPTPPHQDFPLIQGSPNTWTCWIPLGDCPRELGGLAILRGSHRKGVLPVQPSRGAGDPGAARRVAHIPIWAFHGAKDTVVPPSGSREMVEALQAAGGSPRYTEYPRVAHTSWKQAWAEPELIP